MLNNSYKTLFVLPRIRFIFLYTFSVFIFVSCKQESDVKIVKASEPQNIEKETQTLLKKLLENDSIQTIDSVSLSCYKYFKKNYKDQLLWFTKTSLNPNGDSLFNIINKCVYYGLNSDHYHFNKIKSNIDSIHTNKEYVNITALVNADFLLSEAYFLMGAHLNKGRFYPDSLLLHTNFNRLVNGWDSILVSGYETKKLKAALDSLEPKFYGYKMLKEELKRVLNDTLQFQFDSIPFISQKDSAIKSQLLIKTLIKQGFYDTTLQKNDSIKLAKALIKFQKQWFIQPDGKLGKYTTQALSYNRQKIIQQICMAMERWRWENPFPEKYAFINIPAFELTIFEKDTVVMQSAVVCGKPETQTPVLKAKIDHMLIYPYWNVPINIATKEILPIVQRDTTYIRRKNFEVLGANNQVLDYTKVPWKRYTKDYLPVRFRQRIGEENSLGILKFNFYNPYGVYLHDTNSKKYFQTSSRAQSHGCIRLEKFTELANFLIRDDSLNYTPDSLQLYFITEEQRKIKLKKPLPIYTRYYTAHADSLGLKIYLDVYRKDEELMKLIYK